MGVEGRDKTVTDTQTPCCDAQERYNWSIRCSTGWKTQIPSGLGRYGHRVRKVKVMCKKMTRRVEGDPLRAHLGVERCEFYLWVSHFTWP